MANGNGALAVTNQSAAAIISASGFNRDQIELVKSTVAVGATDMELALFLQTAKHRGLDVFARQLHFVKRRTNRQNPITGEWESVMVGTMQTGIDGFRLISDRTTKYDGQDEPEFEYEKDGKTLRFARVRVYRKDISRPIVGLAYWFEYAQTKSNGELQPMWKRMPHTMLAKCAEALALRKAFPENLSGLYSEDEMPPIEGEAIVHADTSGVPTGVVTPMPTQQARATESTSADAIPPAGTDVADLRTWLGKRLGFRTKSWTGEHMGKACAEVANTLGLAEGTITPKNLSDHLPMYREAIASAVGIAAAVSAVEEPASETIVQDAAAIDAEQQDEEEAPEPEAVTSEEDYSRITSLASAKGIANGEELHTRIRAVLGDPDAHVTTLTPERVAKVVTMLEALADKTPA